MRNIICTSIVSLALLAISEFTLGSFTTSQSVSIVNPKNVVVLELFTSQGCSSCPTADALLGTYAKDANSNIIPISFHVDYWNRLGWKDPFSQAGFSERQSAYSRAFNHASIYTPQLIVNGKYELIGSKESEIKKIITEELKSITTYKVEIDSITIHANHLNVRISADLTKNGNFVNVALIKKKEITDIKRGENSGVKLTNYNIVIDFRSIPIEQINSKEILLNFNKNWIPSDYMVVAFLQNSVAGKIIAGTKSEISY